MPDYKVSVIIPVYNAQDTINRCVDSVINQTMGFSNIELILYDDKSTDNTPEILKGYAEKHDNIILILADENSGNPGRGRNEGIKIASADYIMFMDNDDEYRPDMCETLYNEIIKDDADIVSSDYLHIDHLTSKIFHNSIKLGEKKSKNDKIVFSGNEVYDFKDPLVWSKIFKRSVIVQNNVKFPTDKLAEDEYFIYLLLIYINKIVYLRDYVGYVRHGQTDSLSNTINYDKAKKIIDVASEIYWIYVDNNLEVDFSWFFSGNLIFSLMCIYQSNILNYKENVVDLLDHIYEFERKINFTDSYLNIFFKIPNRLIMKKRFGLAIAYFKITKFFHKNEKLKKLYRLYNK